MSILTRKTMLYAGIESTYGTAPVFSDSTSPILVENADYKLDMQTIARPMYRNDLSPVPDIVSRKLSKVTFTHELRNGGTVGSESRLGRLLRACSMVATTRASPWWGSFLAVAGSATPVVSWATGGSISGLTEPKTLMIAVTTGGASGTAKLAITANDGTAPQTNVTATSAAAITLATGGLTATITPTWTGSLVLGQTWVVHVWPAGIQYLPTSTEASVESISLRLYKDGAMHEVNGALGTFKLNAAAGQIAKVDFEFTGIYKEVTDTAMPSSPTFETNLPTQVELGRMHMDGFGISGNVMSPLIVDAFSFDIANKIDPRMSINAAEGIARLRISDRSPTGGFDPEAQLVADQNFWSKLATAKLMPFSMRVGTSAGNTFALFAPQVQYTGLTYKDRNGIQALDAGLKFNRLSGDDEIMLYAC